MTVKLSKVQISGLVIVAILLISIPSYFLLNNPSENFSATDGLYCSSQPTLQIGTPEVIDVGQELIVDLTVNTSEETMLLSASLTVINSSIEYTEVLDLGEIQLNDSTSLQTELNFGSGIEGNHSFLALQNGNYLIKGFNLYYLSCLHFSSMNIPIKKSLVVQDSQVENRAESAEWTLFQSKVENNVSSPPEVSSLSGALLNFSASTFNRSISIETQLDLSGVLELDVLSSFLNISLFIDGSPNGSYFGSIEFPIVSYIGIHNISLGFFLVANSTVSIELSMLTKSITIMTVVIDDQWSSTFPTPEYFLNQVNSRFKRYFNITFAISATIPVIWDGGTDLFELVSYAKEQFNEQLGLNWKEDRVYHQSNYGLNMMLIMTNKTMDHYGIVLGDGGGPFNIAVNAGGSIFAGGQRLSASWGDNLLQHEISHVFGALDRYSSSDSPSVMTKASNATEVLADILNNRLWLTLTNWLYKDLLLMKQVIDNFYT